MYVPNGPGFVIVNVPPTTSSGTSCLARAASARSWISRAIRRRRLPSALRITGATRPLKSRSTAIAEVDVVVHDQRVVADARVHLAGSRAPRRRTPHDERQVREREALVALPLGTVRGADALDPLEVDLDRRVHVRARGLRPHHVLGGAPADVVERDDLVAARRARGDSRRRATGAEPRARRRPACRSPAG